MLARLCRAHRESRAPDPCGPRGVQRASRARDFLLSAPAKALLIAYGILHAILYASLLPLWEGFDEPFHYAYVLTLEREHKLPRLGDAPLPSDVWESLHLAPASPVVKQNLPWVTTYSEFFARPREEQARIRQALDQVRPGGRPDGQNYEAHQAPLAYTILALVEVPWRSAPLPERIWILRLVCGIFAAVATALLLDSLARRLEIPGRYAAVLIFVVLNSQMFYATTAHIANDWLAVPLMVALFDRLAALAQKPDARRTLQVALVLLAGLLTKAYFLAMIPLAAGVIVWLVIEKRLARQTALLALFAIAAAAPWYLRNLRLYGNLTGMQETIGGVDWRGMVTAFVHLPWLRSFRDLAFASVWTGNSSFTSFSSFAVAMMLGGVAVAAAIYLAPAIRMRKPPAIDTILLCGCALFGAALLYSTALSFWYSKGAQIFASAWYTQPMIPVALAILFRGISRGGRAGALAALWLACWSAYILAATYWAKLIPLYGGYPEAGKIVLARLLRWYANPRAIADTLSLTALARGPLIFFLAAIAAAAAAGFAIAFAIAFGGRRLDSGRGN